MQNGSLAVFVAIPTAETVFKLVRTVDPVQIHVIEYGELKEGDGGELN